MKKELYTAKFVRRGRVIKELAMFAQTPERALEIAWNNAANFAGNDGYVIHIYKNGKRIEINSDPKISTVTQELLTVAKLLMAGEEFDTKLAKELGLQLPKKKWSANIAANHLDEMPDYYVKLKKMESGHEA